MLLNKKSAIILLAWLCLAVSSWVVADDDVPYENVGVVENVVEIGTIVILNQQYQLDNGTNIHGKMRLGEVGPKISAGDELGFNYILKGNALYITDVWPISFIDR